MGKKYFRRVYPKTYPVNRDLARKWKYIYRYILIWLEFFLPTIEFEFNGEA
ncbi:hypothetical protein SF83666_a41880 (plasmid) [Sinorhizobium fredii CCBAU 83666]|nr:hypothetical protein SF83666_a41880 [Sinorhizobium fredii CCBAU 83666]